MSAPDLEEVSQALARIVRRRLREGNSVAVPDLGTFSVEHRPSEIQREADGPTYVRPPRNVVRFDPEQ